MTVTSVSENSAAKKNSVEFCMILRMANGAGTQEVSMVGKTVTHTHSHKKKVSHLKDFYYSAF